MKSTSHYILGWRHESRDDVIIHLIYYFALELYILIVRIWRIVKKLYLQRQPTFEYHHQNFSISIYGPWFVQLGMTRYDFSNFCFGLGPIPSGPGSIFGGPTGFCPCISDCNITGNFTGTEIDSWTGQTSVLFRDPWNGPFARPHSTRNCPTRPDRPRSHEI